MEFVLLLLVMTTAINSVSGIQCLTCDSLDKTTCEKSQKTVRCRDEHKACRIISYTDINEELYRKSCIENMSKCDKGCENVPKTIKDCKRWCCDERDNCNEIQPDKKTKKRKRSFHSRSSSKRNSIRDTFVIGGIVVAFVITRGRFSL